MPQQTRRIVQYRVRQGDTLERLALRYTGNAEDWLSLAILNGLDYPYIREDPDYVREVKATGEVLFSRTAGSTGAVSIPQGYVVTVPASETAAAKSYRTLATAVIANGVGEATAAVEALRAGRIGNTPGLTVTGLSGVIANLGRVSNP